MVTNVNMTSAATLRMRECTPALPTATYRSWRSGASNGAAVFVLDPRTTREVPTAAVSIPKTDHRVAKQASPPRGSTG